VVNKTGATPGLPFTWSVYTRSATSGANPNVHASLQFLSASGAALGTATGSTTTLTGSATAAWTRLTVTGTAPAGTVWAQIGIVLTTAPSSAWSWQADGLQLEQNGSASAYQTCPQVSSVVPSGLGASAVLVNLFQPLVNNHSATDYVCDPLPAGTTSPTAAVGTARLAY